MMNDSLSILIDFENCLKQYCESAYLKLGAGLQKDYIREILTRININDENIKELYHWKNGIKVDESTHVGEVDFCSNGKMLPLEEALVHYELCTKDNLWGNNFFPLLSSNAGDFLLYNTDRKSKTYGMLCFYSPSLLIVEPETSYDSIESFCKTVIACYQQEAYKYNESDNRLEVSDDDEFKISSEKNPRSEYWKRGK